MTKRVLSKLTDVQNFNIFFSVKRKKDALDEEKREEEELKQQSDVDDYNDYIGNLLRGIDHGSRTAYKAQRNHFDNSFTTNFLHLNF